MDKTIRLEQLKKLGEICNEVVKSFEDEYFIERLNEDSNRASEAKKRALELDVLTLTNQRADLEKNNALMLIEKQNKLNDLEKILQENIYETNKLKEEAKQEKAKYEKLSKELNIKYG